MSNEHIEDVLSDLISIKAAAELKKVSPQAIDYRIQKGDLKITQIAGHNFVSKTAVEKLNFREANSEKREKLLISVEDAISVLKTTRLKIQNYIAHGYLKLRNCGGREFLLKEDVEILKIIRQKEGRILTISQAAKIHPKDTPIAINNLIKTGELEVVEYGGFKFVYKRAVEKLTKDQRKINWQNRKKIERLEKAAEKAAEKTEAEKPKARPKPKAKPKPKPKAKRKPKPKPKKKKKTGKNRTAKKPPEAN